MRFWIVMTALCVGLMSAWSSARAETPIVDITRDLESVKQFDAIEGVTHHGPVLKVPMPASMKLEDVIFELESALAEENLNIVGRNEIGKAIGKRNGEPFPAFTILHICNLTAGEKIIRNEPAFGAFLPCKVVLYEESPGGRVWIVTYKPTFAMIYFPDMPEEAKAAAGEIGDKLFNIIHELVVSNM
ncbi:DUF302 domain-containing protein [Magnetofaba australis]|uniref:DUF302 domain-containing protein n=1 Tax=Magnetofaba australis IT-1 TaxID=1434232 RepID=A0A1Y2K9Y4_9PROT|nr:DUF302 domain-containing protein [Magnetofaba australis]OSM06171.1 hypothetical protein MAIT1_01140 [Magnetofaba australis IT-1]